MSLSRDSKQERLAKFTLRSRFRYKQGVERILWEEEVLIPQIEMMKSGKGIPALGVGEGEAFDIEVVDDARADQETTDSASDKPRGR